MIARSESEAAEPSIPELIKVLERGHLTPISKEIVYENDDNPAIIFVLASLDPQGSRTTGVRPVELYRFTLKDLEAATAWETEEPITLALQELTRSVHVAPSSFSKLSPRS